MFIKKTIKTVLLIKTVRPVLTEEELALLTQSVALTGLSVDCVSTIADNLAEIYGEYAREKFIKKLNDTLSFMPCPRAIC